MSALKKILKGVLVIFFISAALNIVESTPVVPPIGVSLDKSEEIIIGVEYVVHGLGEGFSDLGIPAVKPLPQSLSWDKMQKGPDDPIDFNITDRYVKEFQDNGFTHIVFGLKISADSIISPWMIDERYPKTQAVDPKYHSHYSNWVRSLVERYDMDGVQDMPGLKYPVAHYEIGVEFSSYQPEPTEVYLKTLELGYKAAHEAYDDVIVAHSAFLVTPVFKDDPGPDDYENAFTENMMGTAGKGLEDIRMVLDRPDLFDVLNVHNLGWPYEIERIVKWLNYETEKRGYSKPINISDTVPTSFAGMGPATKCEGDRLAVMLPPATEADRCRLAEYFKKLINKDQEYIDWLRNFLAADVVQRVVIAAEQGIELIDTAFTEDLPLATLAIFQAAAGNSAWGGMVDYEVDILAGEHTVVGKRPPYYSLQQLQANIKGYTSITRAAASEDLRLYKVEKSGETFFIAWYGYQKLYLPDDPIPSKTFQIDVGLDSVIVEEMKTSPNVTRKTATTNNGILDLELTPEPVYIFITTHNASVDGWAVLLEMNEFPEGWSDLPVEFINSERMQTALFSLGWQSDHVHIINDNLTISAVQEAVEWLVNNTDCDDIALLYIFTHGRWMRNVLLWNDWFPTEWQKLNTSRKILIVDSCHAEEFIEPIKDDLSPHISLACCSADEVSWAGVEEEGLPVIGSVWNYYFTNALCNSSADLDSNGLVSIEEAFNFSTPLVQRYMNETVFAVPEFLESYHDIGIYPGNYNAYPHPVMDDGYPDQLVVPEFPSFLILPLFMIATLLAVMLYRMRSKNQSTRSMSSCISLISLSTIDFLISSEKLFA